MPFKGKTHKGCGVSMCNGHECCTAQDSTAVGSNAVDLLVVGAQTSSEETQFVLCNSVNVTFEGNLWRCVFVSKCSSSIQFDHVCPLPACCRATAETSSPLPQQRGWAKCSSPLLCALLLCAAPQLVLHGAGSLQGAFISESPGAASLRSNREQFCPAAWEMPTAETLNIQAEPVA